MIGVITIITVLDYHCNYHNCSNYRVRVHGFWMLVYILGCTLDFCCSFLMHSQWVSFLPISVWMHAMQTWCYFVACWAPG